MKQAEEERVRAERATQRFRRSLGAAVLVPVVLVAAVAALFALQVRALLNSEQAQDQSNKTLTQLNIVRRLLIDRETGFRGYLLTGRAHFNEPWDKANAQLPSRFQALSEALAPTPEQLRALNRLQQGAEVWEKLAQTERARFQRERRADLEVQEEGKRQMDALRAQADALANQELQLRTQREQSAARTARRVLALGAICALLLGLGLASFGRRQLAHLSHGYEEALRAERERGRALRVSEERVRALNRELEIKVQERTSALVEANRELEAFSYSVSHDLRAPLRHIAGFTELLEQQARGKLDVKGNHYLETLRASARHAGALVDDLLAFSRMSRSEMQRYEVDCQKVVADVQRDLMLAGTDGREVEWKIGPLPRVHADPAMLTLVFQNLLSNALKYSRTRHPARIEVGAEHRDGEHLFFVRDNGVGFDMRYVDKLFGVFQRLHRAEDFEGTGIGLANVQRIISRHGGKVWAEGAVDQGATFTFTLPEEPREAEAPTSPRATADVSEARA